MSLNHCMFHALMSVHIHTIENAKKHPPKKKTLTFLGSECLEYTKKGFALLQNVIKIFKRILLFSVFLFLQQNVRAFVFGINFSENFQRKQKKNCWMSLNLFPSLFIVRYKCFAIWYFFIRQRVKSGNLNSKAHVPLQCSGAINSYRESGKKAIMCCWHHTADRRRKITEMIIKFYVDVGCV
jgi:hypothetical protein